MTDTPTNTPAALPSISGARPAIEAPGLAVYAGDSMALMQGLPDAAVQAVVTDPPYSSGGLMRGDRTAKTSAKYVLTGTVRKLPEFSGDNRDQRSHLKWCAWWLSECFRVTAPGGVLLMFSDWRQLPTMTDAVQMAGWVWRGLVPWDKTEATRPQMGWFRAQCEYVITATHGPMLREQDRLHRVCLPGISRNGVEAREKRHITGKPITVMEHLLRAVPAGVVLDPFCGSGSTLIAARRRGLSAIGMEVAPEYVEVTRERLRDGEGQA